MSQYKIEPDVDAAFEEFLKGNSKCKEVADEEETFYLSVFHPNRPDHPDMWFPDRKDCEQCQGYVNKTDGCGNLVCPDCHSKVHGKTSTTATTTATATTSSPSSSVTNCSFGASCRFVNSPGGCHNFHPESDKKPSTASTRSDEPNRCKKGAGCFHVKTGNCRFFHPAEEIPVCRFGVRCNKGGNCKFKH